MLNLLNFTRDVVSLPLRGHCVLAQTLRLISAIVTLPQHNQANTLLFVAEAKTQWTRDDEYKKNSFLLYKQSERLRWGRSMHSQCMQKISRLGRLRFNRRLRLIKKSKACVSLCFLVRLCKETDHFRFSFAYPLLRNCHTTV